MTKEIYPCLWFEKNARTAADYYCSVFRNSKVISENQFVVMFEVNGKKFMAMNGGSQNKFNDSVSFVISCETQEEIDHYWNTLTRGGQEGMCGWLKDRYGLSWQVVPSELEQWMNDPARANRISPVLMTMKKLDLKKLKNA